MTRARARTGVPGSTDSATERRLRQSLGQLGPDPLFERRLRGSIVNYYVATREGHVRPRAPRRQMGVIGRSVLYASLALAIGVTAVGAASQDSLPGDPLYGVKLRLEQIRMEIAPPSVRDDLAQLAVAERTRELQKLVAKGQWTAVTAAADAVIRAEATLVTFTPTAGTAATTDDALVVLQGVLDRAPDAARPGLEQALQAAARNASAAAGVQPGEPANAAQPTHPAHPSHPPNGGEENGTKTGQQAP